MRIIQFFISSGCIAAFAIFGSNLRRAIDPEDKAYLDLYIPLMMISAYLAAKSWPIQKK